MRETVLAFDFGTSYFKAALLDAQGDIAGFHRVPTPIVRNGLRSEIDPEVFRKTVRTITAALAAHSPEGFAGVRAVTFCTQANTFVLLDAEDRPLTPLIVWNDERAWPTNPAIANLPLDPLYAARTGMPETHHYLAMAKVRWLMRADPSLRSKVARLRFIGDEFTHWLTGAHVTDGSIAAISGMFDVVDWTWNDAWAAAGEVDRCWLPAVERAVTARPIRPSAANELGLPPGCVFVTGCLDQYAGAMGVGNDRVGEFSETTGTVLATLSCASTFAAPETPHAFRGPGATPGTFYHMTFGDVSAALLAHYRQQLPDHPSFESLDAAAAEASGPCLRLDHRLPADALRAQITAWAPSEPRADVVLCIYETVAAALGEQVRELAGGKPVTAVRSAGGASRSRLWLQIKAATLGCPVLAPRSPEPTLVGVLSLAAPHLGWPSPMAGLQPHVTSPADAASGRRPRRAM